MIKPVAIYCLSIIMCLTGCISSNKVKDGKTAFELKRYSLAIELLKKEYNQSSKREDKSAKAHLIGQSYDKLSDYIRAIEWYAHAEKADYGITATYNKAYALKKAMRYQEAMDVFASLDGIPSLSAEVRIQRQLCNSFQMERNNVAKDVSVEKFLNDSYHSDYCPVNYDDDFIVITSDRDEATGSKKYDWTGNKFSDLFIIDKESREVKRFDTAINSEYNDGTPAFNKNFSVMVFTRCYNLTNEKDDHCKLMLSLRKEGLWSDPIPLSFVLENQNYGQPCFIEKDSVLVFSSKVRGNNHYDLYYSEYDGSQFSEPDILPSSINSSYNEHFPTADGDTLYFSSDNNLGMGGYDIYKTWHDKSGKWHKPTRLPFPVNSGGDDFAFIKDYTLPRTKNISSIAYFTSNRSNDGRDAIYEYKSFKIADDETEPKVEQEKNTFDIYLALKVGYPIYENDNPAMAKIGKKNLHGAFISIWSGGKVILEGDSDKNGLLLTQLVNDTDYTIKVSKDSFLNNVIQLSTKGLLLADGESSITINREVLLDRLYRGREIVLENIYYDYEKWNIKKEAEPSLNALIAILRNNPSISIELGSHTDCRGAEDYNLDLSQKRAQSAIDYIVAGGISIERLKAKGYGESSPAINCECNLCNEEEHQRNRRTSFKIL